MAVDRPGLEGGELGEAGRIAPEHAGEIHEFREAEHLRMVGERQEIADFEPRAGGLQIGRGHAARQLHAQVHRHRHRGVEEEADPRRPEHIGDLVRIADRGGDAVPQHAAVEFQRRDQRAFDVAMGVDEAGNDDLAADVDLALAAIVAERPDNAVADRWRRRPREGRR